MLRLAVLAWAASLAAMLALYVSVVAVQAAARLLRRASEAPPTVDVQVPVQRQARPVEERSAA